MLNSRSLWFARLRSLVNRARRLDRAGMAKVAAAMLFVASVWVALYLGVHRLLGTLYDVELLGPFLADRLLVVLLLALLGVLVLSNTITSLATFYLADDLIVLNAAPVSTVRLFYERFGATLGASSWMAVVFGVPVVAAYGTVHSAPTAYYLVAAMAGVGLVLVPAAVGTVVTTALVNVFPARAARDLLLIVSAAFLGLAWFVLRAIRPERLVDPESFGGLAEFLGALSVPESSWLPSTWCARAMSAALRGHVGEGLGQAGFVLLWGAAFVALASWWACLLYRRGYSKAQEGAPLRLRLLAGRWLERAARAAMGGRSGALVAKDAKVVVRDPAQWSQLVLLLALVAIYVLSIRALPFDVLTFDTTSYRNFVAFVNVGMTGFVQAAVAARFVFPGISSEGRSIWLLRSAPLSGYDLVVAKWSGGTVPVVLLGAVLAVASNHYLATHEVVRYLALADAVAGGVVVCALAAGFGAALPDFKAAHPVQAAASFGGVVYMAASLFTIGVALALQAYPTYALLRAARGGASLTANLPAVAVWYGASLVFFAATAAASLRLGARALERREY